MLICFMSRPLTCSSNQTELVLPEAIYDAVWASIESRISAASRYARVIMPLSAIIEGDFFNKYIKIGNDVPFWTRRPIISGIVC